MTSRPTKTYGARTRTEGVLTLGSHYINDYNPSGLLTSSTLVQSGGYANGSYKSTSDVVTKDYLKRKARGDIIMNPMSFVDYNRLCPLVTLSTGNHPVWGKRVFIGAMACDWWQVQGALNPKNLKPSWFVADVNSAKNIALTRATAAANQSIAQLMVTIAEGHKTGSMVIGPLGRAVNMANRVLARKLSLIRRGVNAAKAGAQAWLEYRYGWRPLMYDIELISKAHSDLLKRSSNERRVTRASEHLQFSVRNTDTSPVPSGLTSLTMENYEQWTTRVFAGCIFDVDDANSQGSIRHALGLDLQSVPATIWELVPFSFVVDWFVNVGDWLGASMPNPRVKHLGNWVTVREDFVGTHEVLSAKIHVANPPDTWYELGSVGYAEHDTTYTRTVNQSISLIPVSTNRDIGLLHAIDLAALLLQILRKIR